MLQLGTGNEYASQVFASPKKIGYRDTDVTIYRRMLDNNADRLDETVLICADKAMSYRTIIRQADHVADVLTSLGIRKNDMIMLAGEGCAQTVSILLACSKIGVGILMLRDKTPEETFNMTVSTIDIPLMFCEAGEYVKYAAMAGTAELSRVVILPVGVAIGEDETAGGSAANNSSNVILWKDFLNIPVTEEGEEVLGGNYPLAICSTTGSTGVPKGIVMPNSSFVALERKIKMNDMSWEVGDVILSIVPPYIVSGLSIVLLVPMLLGMTVVLEPNRADMPLFLGEIGRYRINHVFSTKSPWIIMAEVFRDGWDLSSVKGAYTVGEPISETEYDKINGYLKALGATGRLQNYYGLSESNSILTCATQNSTSSAGRALIGDTIAIFDTETQEEKKLGEIGELYFRSPSMMKEYLYNPKATREFFIRDNEGNRWARTGDLASIDEKGEITVYGRMKEKFTDENGAVLFPYMIERIIGDEENIYRLKMISTERDGKPCVALHIVPKSQPDDPKAYADKLYAMLCSDGSLSVLPKRIKLRPDFPMNDGGKVDMIAMAAEEEGFFEYE